MKNRRYLFLWIWLMSGCSLIYCQTYQAKIQLRVSRQIIDFRVSKVLSTALINEKGLGIKLSLIESIRTPSDELVQQITALYPAATVSSSDNAEFTILLTDVIIPPKMPEVFNPIKHRSYSWNLITGKTAWTELNLISQLPGDRTILTDFGLACGYWGNSPRTISTNMRLGFGTSTQMLNTETDLLVGFMQKFLWKSYYRGAPSVAESRDAIWNTGYFNMRLLQHYPLKWYPGHILNVGIQLNLLTTSQLEIANPVVLILGIGSKL